MACVGFLQHSGRSLHGESADKSCYFGGCGAAEKVVLWLHLAAPFLLVRVLQKCLGDDQIVYGGWQL